MEIANEAFNKVSNTREQKAAKQKALEEIEGKITLLQKKVSLAYNDRLDGIITESDFIDFKKTFDEEKATYTNRKEQIERELAEFEARLKTQSNINNLMDKYNRVDELTHEIVNDFVDSVVIGEKDPITNKQKKKKKKIKKKKIFKFITTAY